MPIKILHMLVLMHANMIYDAYILGLQQMPVFNIQIFGILDAFINQY